MTPDRFRPISIEAASTLRIGPGEFHLSRSQTLPRDVTFLGARPDQTVVHVYDLACQGTTSFRDLTLVLDSGPLRQNAESRLVLTNVRLFSTRPDPFPRQGYLEIENGRLIFRQASGIALGLTSIAKLTNVTVDAIVSGSYATLVQATAPASLNRCFFRLRLLSSANQIVLSAGPVAIDGLCVDLIGTGSASVSGFGSAVVVGSSHGLSVSVGQGIAYARLDWPGPFDPTIPQSNAWWAGWDESPWSQHDPTDHRCGYHFSFEDSYENGRWRTRARPYSLAPMSG